MNEKSFTEALEYDSHAVIFIIKMSYARYIENCFLRSIGFVEYFAKIWNKENSDSCLNQNLKIRTFLLALAILLNKDICRQVLNFNASSFWADMSD